LELYLRFEILANGNFISTRCTAADYNMSVEINNDVFKLKIKLDEYFNEVSIKFEYIDSSWIHLEIEQHDNSWCLSVNDHKRSLMMPDEVFVELCEDHMYIGNFQVNKNINKLIKTKYTIICYNTNKPKGERRRVNLIQYFHNNLKEN